MTQRPTAAVIGAGISGLTAGKNLADHGIEYECFETSDRIGGNWAFRNPNGHSSAYRSLHIDTSKELLSFKDFPMPDHYPDYPHHSEIKAYLEDYAAAFNLKERIRFENGVEHAERLTGGGWELKTQDGETRRFDVLVVANGHHWDPRYPDFPGRFDGDSIHSHHYIDPTEPLDLKGKRILVVGIGNSAADVVSELSQKSWDNTVFLSTRSGAWVMPKYVFGRPTDRLAHT
ncbi:MAG TPA: NAD(P)-binding domain-containing protein, partial [Solirubrobacteraceae bacterium]